MLVRDYNKNVNKHDTCVLGSRKHTHTRFNLHIFALMKETHVKVEGSS